MCKRLCYQTLTLAILVGCATAQQTSTLERATRPVAESQPTGIRFELTSSKPFVPVRVNDSEPLWFILDTGNGGGFCIDRTRAATLGLSLSEEQEAHIGAGEGVTVKTAVTGGLNVRIGHITMADQTATVLPLDHVAACEGRAVDGLIGRSFISRFVVELDYANTTMRLHDPTTFDYTGPGRSLPTKFRGGLLTTAGSITLPGGEPISGTFVIDTGARPALVLNKPFADEHKLLEKLPKALHTTIGGGAGGECRGYVGRLERMQLGPFQINEPVASCAQDRTGVLASPAFSGIVGGPMLRRCRVFFDYQGERMILEPYASKPTPYEYDMSGLFLTAKGPDFTQLTVMSVMEDSPAAEAGVRPGDVILTINGKPASGFTLEQLRTLLRQPGRKLRLELQRGEERLQISLTLRRLV